MGKPVKPIFADPYTIGNELAMIQGRLRGIRLGLRQLRLDRTADKPLNDDESWLASVLEDALLTQADALEQLEVQVDAFRLTGKAVA